MRGAVVLDAESLGGIEEVRPADEMTAFVIQRHLCQRPGQSANDDLQAETGLHRRLGERLDQLQDAPEASSAPPPRPGGGKCLEIRDGDEALVQRHVGRRHRLDEGWRRREIDDRSQRRCGGLSMDTTLSWWADACAPGRRTRNLQVDGQQIHEVTRLVGRRPPS